MVGAGSGIVCRFALGPALASTVRGNSRAMLRSLRDRGQLESRIRPLVALTLSQVDGSLIPADSSRMGVYIALTNGAGTPGLTAAVAVRSIGRSVLERDRYLTPLARALAGTLAPARTYGDALSELYGRWGIIAFPDPSWGDDDAALPAAIPLAWRHALDPVPATSPLLEAMTYSRPFIRRMATPPAIVAPFRYSSQRRCAPVPPTVRVSRPGATGSVTTPDGDTLHLVYERAAHDPMAMAMASQILRVGASAQTPASVVAAGAEQVDGQSGDLWSAWGEAERAQWDAVLPHRQASATLPGPLTVAGLEQLLPGAGIRIASHSFWIRSLTLTDEPPRVRAELELTEP